eukprot:gb/GEZN01028772.1/.p1 GENE.gb/GEZN01028772.1/~~gb/GEZN01028772.1/.p1  ORF type:complete len:154 (+),score=40.34 gb/GEZN01028772.1/:3-464(+)
MLKGVLDEMDKKKEAANAAFKIKAFPLAIRLYQEAIKMAEDEEGCKTKHMEPHSRLKFSLHVLFSNLSAAYLSQADGVGEEQKKLKAEEALRAGKMSVLCSPTWPKGYSRVGSAFLSLGRWQEALDAYQEGLEHAPGDAGLQDGLRLAAQNSS